MRKKGLLWLFWQRDAVSIRGASILELSKTVAQKNKVKQWTFQITVHSKVTVWQRPKLTVDGPG